MNYFKFGSTGLLGSFQLNMLPTSIKVNDVTQYTHHQSFNMFSGIFLDNSSDHELAA